MCAVISSCARAMRSIWFCRASMVDEEGEGEEFRPWWVLDLRAAGTLRLMFSRASRRSAWKSGWRNVHDWEGCVVRGWACGRVGK